MRPDIEELIEKLRQQGAKSIRIDEHYGVTEVVFFEPLTAYERERLTDKGLALQTLQQIDAEIGGWFLSRGDLIPVDKVIDLLRKYQRELR